MIDITMLKLGRGKRTRKTNDDSGQNCLNLNDLFDMTTHSAILNKDCMCFISNKCKLQGITHSILKS